jgi:hypothetical protein
VSGEARTCGIGARLSAVRERIAAAARRAGRAPDAVTLVGVAKQQPAAVVAAAVRAGLGCVGENFAQEARAKIPAVREMLAGAGVAVPRWHFIGQLQQNKARLVAPLFDCVESVDRLALAAELDRRAAAAGRTLDVLLQVNVSGEAQKGGVAPGELPGLVDAVSALGHLRLRGLMAIPEASDDPEASRPAFARLRALRDALGRPEVVELSMGMSADFEVAIEEGATLVRVGTALFGAREAR